MTHAVETSLDSKVLQTVHCLTVTRFGLGRLDNFAWQHAIHCEDLNSEDSTMGMYLERSLRRRLFGADTWPLDVGPKPPFPHTTMVDPTPLQNPLAQCFNGKLFLLVALEPPSTGRPCPDEALYDMHRR